MFTLLYWGEFVKNSIEDLALKPILSAFADPPFKQLYCTMIGRDNLTRSLAVR